MSYSVIWVIVAIVGCLIGSLIVFLFIADKFINIGIKMAQKGDFTPKVNLLPKLPKKVKESKEVEETRKRMEMIDNYTGYKEN